MPELADACRRSGKSSWSSCGAERQEELEDLVQHLVGAGVLAVDLVDHDDWLEVEVERLLEHELGAGQRALGSVDQEQHAIDHGQGALDLAAEVGVAGRVDDVDLGAFVEDGRVLGQDRDAALASPGRSSP